MGTTNAHPQLRKRKGKPIDIPKDKDNYSIPRKSGQQARPIEIDNYNNAHSSRIKNNKGTEKKKRSLEYERGGGIVVVEEREMITVDDDDDDDDDNNDTTTTNNHGKQNNNNNISSSRTKSNRGKSKEKYSQRNIINNVDMNLEDEQLIHDNFEDATPRKKKNFFFDTTTLYTSKSCQTRK